MASPQARLQFCEDAWKLIRQQGESKRPIPRTPADPGEEAQKLDPQLYLQALLEGYLARCPEPIGLHRKAAEQVRKQLLAGAEIRELRWPREGMSRKELLTQTEWFSVRVLGGSYGGGAEGMLFTLRWRTAVWDIVRGGGAYGGVGFHNRPHSSFFYVGTAFGGQFQVGPTPLNELRFKTGIAFGATSQNLETVYVGASRGRGGIGPMLIPEFSWVRHFLQHFALEVGIETFIPLGAFSFDSCEADCGLPEPPLMLFVGFRI